MGFGVLVENAGVEVSVGEVVLGVDFEVEFAAVFVHGGVPVDVEVFEGEGVVGVVPVEVD